MTDNAFRLSRVQAEGWNAARKFSSGDAADFDDGKIAGLNPYKTEPERNRWSDGFKSALQR